MPTQSLQHMWTNRVPFRLQYTSTLELFPKSFAIWLEYPRFPLHLYLLMLLFYQFLLFALSLSFSQISLMHFLLPHLFMEGYLSRLQINTDSGTGSVEYTSWSTKFLSFLLPVLSPNLQMLVLVVWSAQYTILNPNVFIRKNVICRL